MKAERQPKINLLTYRQEEAELKRQSQRKVIMVIVVTVLLVGVAATSWWSQNQQVKALEQQNQQLQKEVEDLSNLAATSGRVSEQKVKKLGSRKALLDKLQEERTIDLEQLEVIYVLGFPNITISKMDIKDGGEITINAYANRQGNLIAFVENLQNEDSVKEIQKVTSNRNDKTGEISFTLVLAGEGTGQ